MANAKIVSVQEEVVNVAIVLGMVALYATRQEDVTLVAGRVFVAAVMELDGFGFVKLATKLELLV
ncbi:MAG: hypothetical protein WCQ26_02225 [Pseudanabaena sp. ELA748]